MWTRLDDALLDHRKIFIAGKTLGSNGPGLALALFTMGLLYSNKHLTDGKLPRDVVASFPHLKDPLKVADALVKSRLWIQKGNSFSVHDFSDFNPSSREIKRRRKADRMRKYRGKS